MELIQNTSAPETDALDPTGMNRALKLILAERKRQFVKWGEQDHSMPVWMLILQEEAGELSEALLHSKFGGPAANKVMEEAVQTAAVALQIIQYLVRTDESQWVR